MSIQRTTLALVTALSLGLGALAFAGPPADGAHEHGSMIGRVIDLTDEQEAMLASIREETRADAEQLATELGSNREAFKAEMQSEKPDKGELHDLIDESAQLKADFRKAELDRMWPFLQTLTPEQRAELAKAREEHPGFRPGHGRWGGGPDGRGPAGPDGRGGPRQRAPRGDR